MSRTKNRRSKLQKIQNAERESNGSPEGRNKRKRERDASQRAGKRLKSSVQRDSQAKPGSRVISAASLQLTSSFSVLQDTPLDSDQTMSVNLGQNRLKSGFVNTQATTRDGESAEHMVHEVESSDDGGITLNVHNKSHEPIVISDDDSGSEDGEVHSSHEDTEMSADHAQNPQDHANIPPVSSNGTTNIRDQSRSITPIYLRDLSPERLEIQLKYAFWQLGRDEIDLNRMARCLECQEEGHIDSECSRKTCRHCGAYAEHDELLCDKVRPCPVCRQPGHQNCDGLKNTTMPCTLCRTSGHNEARCNLRHFLRPNTSAMPHLDLWISCCGCASRSHLVGDCPQINTADAARWSLKNTESDRITNLSVQTGMDNYTRSAETRGTRPDAMKIKGRANKFTKPLQESDSDELSAFLGQRSHNEQTGLRQRGSKQQQAQQNASRQPRYDKFAASNLAADSYRPPRNNYYATDSFGRPRSRSASPRRDDTYDSYRPQQSNSSRFQPRSGSVHGNQPQNQSRNISIRLPTRPPNNKPQALNGAAPTRKRTRKKK